MITKEFLDLKQSFAILLYLKIFYLTQNVKSYSFIKNFMFQKLNLILHTHNLKFFKCISKAEKNILFLKR